MSKKLKEIPKFASEAEEREFWQTHDTTDYLDWSQAQKVTFPNLKEVHLVATSSGATLADLRKIVQAFPHLDKDDTSFDADMDITGVARLYGRGV